MANYAAEFEVEIKETIPEITNFESKYKFFSSEANYEKIQFPENFLHKNQMSTRNKTNSCSIKLANQVRNKSMFDFYIKSGEDGSFEKLVID